jgi:REP element-mobilizing transposase RayT
MVHVRKTNVSWAKKTMAFYNETQAEQAFQEAVPVFHLYTKGLETEVLFYSDEERRLALNYMAIACYETGCILLAFAIMTNHFHFLLMGEREQVSEFYERFLQLLKNYYSHHGRSLPASRLEPGLTSIDNVKQLRTELAYVIRNAFVVDPDVNVFADPWSSGNLYFNPLLAREGHPASTLRGRALREFTKSRMIVSLDSRIHVKDGVAQPWSFVDYKKAESFYDNPRQFVNSVLKNVEAQVETSLRYGEDPALNDDEMWPIVFGLCREKFKADKPSLLSLEDKKQLAIQLKNRYRSSNKQLARLTGLPLKEVDAMYPLSGKAQNR